MEIAVVLPVPPCTTGKGNSPPERKRAGRPLSVVSVGSASTCRICFCSRSFTVSPTFSLELYRKMLSGSLTVSEEPLPVAVLLNCWVEVANGGAASRERC